MTIRTEAITSGHQRTPRETWPAAPSHGAARACHGGEGCGARHPAPVSPRGPGEVRPRDRGGRSGRTADMQRASPVTTAVYSGRPVPSLSPASQAPGRGARVPFRPERVSAMGRESGTRDGPRTKRLQPLRACLDALGRQPGHENPSRQAPRGRDARETSPPDDGQIVTQRGDLAPSPRTTVLRGPRQEQICVGQRTL